MIKHPKASIIMRTKNSDWVISEALAGLFSQSYKDFELIVVDSGSTDKTLEIVQNYPCRIISIAPEDYFPGKVLNQAVQQAKGEILVFQNSDVVPLNSETLKNLLKPFEKEEVMATFSRQLPRPEADTWVRRDYEVSFPKEKTAPEWMTLSLPLAAMRKSIWKRHPFYTLAWGSEDTEWGLWAKKHGYTVAYVPDAEVMHSHNYSLKEIYGRRFIEGEADAFIYKKKSNLFQSFKQLLGSLRSDLKYHLLHRDFNAIPLIPIRRSVYHWAYYKGHHFGSKRIQNGSNNAQFGQNVVLSRYGK